MKNYFIMTIVVFLLINCSQSNTEKCFKISGDRCNYYTEDDKFTLSVRWQSGLCASDNKIETAVREDLMKECQALKNNKWVANGFTLHGLWPGSKRCNANDCDMITKSSFCFYNPLQLNDQISAKLKEVMPSYKYNSCLERHEWYKHGTCSLLDVNEYFDLSYDLITQFNNSEFTNLIISRKGKTISLKEIQDKFQESFPVNDINHVKFMCDNNNNLVEIFIDLPATIKKGDTLIDLIARLNDKGCGKSTCDGRKIINILS